MSLISELKRRRVFRALIAWGIAAFAILQIIEPVMHGLHWPDAVLGYVVVALALGFPVVVAVAWTFDVAEPAKPFRGRRVAAAVAGIGAIAALPGLAWYFVLRHPAPRDRSIAVLPFASFGAERDTAYFADGFHDELLRQMARLGDLQVISRTSVLQYKEGARNLREIADALGVSSIVEGSVQRAGNRVRVEARLVDARRDRQLWAESYDRDLTDVFAIESDVAQEVANALRARLSPGEKEQLERPPTQSSEAYDLYLRALEYDSRPDMQPRDLAATETLYRRAIAADPSFALAHARLARALLNRSWFVAGTPRSVVDDARHETDEALRLDPNLPQSHLAMGYLHYWGERDYEAALRDFELARAGAAAEALERSRTSSAGRAGSSNRPDTSSRPPPSIRGRRGLSSRSARRCSISAAIRNQKALSSARCGSRRIRTPRWSVSRSSTSNGKGIPRRRGSCCPRSRGDSIPMGGSPCCRG